MQKLILIAFALVALAANGLAITRPPLPGYATNQPTLWQSSLLFGFSLERGNSDTMLTDGKLETHRNNLTNEVTASLEGAYGVNNSVKSDELLHGLGQYNHLFTERCYAYALGDAFHDGIADITYRFTVSPGAGYYFIKRPEMTFAVEAGPGGVFEKIDGSHKNYFTPRLAERFDRKLDDRAHIWENVEFLPQLDQGNNFLINSEVGAEAPISKRMSLRVVLQDNYVNLPASGHKNNDLKLISGLVYKF